VVRIASRDFKLGKNHGLVHCSVKNAAVLCETKKILAVWWLSGSVLSRCFLAPLDVLLVIEDER